MSPLGVGEVMPDFAFRMMVWFMKIEDLFGGPAKLLKKVPLKPGMTVVDYACGPGRYTVPVAETVGPSGKVHAVDNQHLAIEMTRHKAERRGLTNVQAVLVQGFSTGLPDAVADVVLLIDALALIADHEALFREIHRLMKADGRLFVDPTHMKLASARSIIDGTGLFTTVKIDGRSILLSKNTGGVSG
jgi:ubiquinone/menaquinone biosynthesis C-methylase UbiE